MWEADWMSDGAKHTRGTFAYIMSGAYMRHCIPHLLLLSHALSIVHLRQRHVK